MSTFLLMQIRRLYTLVAACAAETYSSYRPRLALQGAFDDGSTGQGLPKALFRLDEPELFGTQVGHCSYPFDDGACTSSEVFECRMCDFRLPPLAKSRFSRTRPSCPSSFPYKS